MAMKSAAVGAGVALVVVAMTTAACQRSGNPSYTSAVPTPPAVSTVPGQAGATACAALTGTPVPTSLDSVTCNSGSNAIAKRAYPCRAGGQYFRLSVISKQNREVATFVGRPGRTWAGGSKPAAQLAHSIGC